MFDLGATELLVIGVVAIIVIGPKDLPGLFRSVGQFTARMRGMAHEFKSALETSASESGVSDIANEIKAATSPKAMGIDAVKDAAESFTSWDPLKAAKPGAQKKKGTAKPKAQNAAGGHKTASKVKDDSAATPQVKARKTSAQKTKRSAAEQGPETTALAKRQAVRKDAARQAAQTLRKAAEPESAAPAPPSKKRSAAKTPAIKTSAVKASGAKTSVAKTSTAKTSTAKTATQKTPTKKPAKTAAKAATT